MTPDEIERLSRRYLAARFDEIEERLSREMSEEQNEGLSFYLTDEAARISGALGHGDVQAQLGQAREMAPEADESQQRRLARRLLEADLEAATAEIRALEGEPLRRPPSLMTQDGPRPVPEEQRATPRISEITDLYCEERASQGKWNAKTRQQSQTIFQLIADLLGDPEVGRVTKADIRTLGVELTQLPVNMSKKFPGMSPRDVLNAVEGTEVVRHQPRSVNKNRQHVRTLFQWAADHDYISTSPATILHDVEEGRAQDARKPFTDDDITALFEHLGNLDAEPYAIWIPRIMAYTGCRMGEAAQLRTADVRQEQDTWVFDLNEDDGKTLKTDNSTRLVPVHPRLVELGLLELVRAGSGEHLFPERVRITDNPSRGNVDRLSKQLNRWLRQAGITDKKKAFQSFRSTFSTRLKDLGIPEYQIAELMGHENSNITTGRYGKRTNLATLADALARLSLPI